MGLFSKKGKDSGASAGSKIKISLTNSGTEYTFFVEGRLDTLTSPELEGKVNEVVADATKLMFDIKKLEYISSAGLRVLLGAAQAMEGKGEMLVCHPTEAVREIFDLTGFANLFTIV